MFLRFKIDYDCAKDIPDSELLTLHKKYWTMIAEDNLDSKPQIIYQNGLDCWDILANCFLCEYAKRVGRISDGFCNYCPSHLSYTKDNGCLNGLYWKWLIAESLSYEKKELAWKIANLKLGEVKDD